MILIYQSPAINFLMIGLKVMSLGCISFVGLFFHKFSLNLCSKPTFLVANDQSSRNACNKSVSNKLDLTIFQGDNVAAFGRKLCS